MSDNDDFERLKNFTIYKLWMTDKEIEETPFSFWLILVVLMIVIALAFALGGSSK